MIKGTSFQQRILALSICGTAALASQISHAGCAAGSTTWIPRAALLNRFGTTSFQDFNIDLGSFFGLNLPECRGLRINQVAVVAASWATDREEERTQPEVQLWPNGYKSDEKNVTNDSFQIQYLNPMGSNIIGVNLNYLGFRAQGKVTIDHFEISFGTDTDESPAPIVTLLGRTNFASSNGTFTAFSPPPPLVKNRRVIVIAKNAPVELRLFQARFANGQSFEVRSLYLNPGERRVFDFGMTRNVLEIQTLIVSPYNNGAYLEIYGVQDAKTLP